MFQEKNSWTDQRQLPSSIAETSRFLKETILCIWRTEKNFLDHALLKRSKLVNTDRYRSQMIIMNDALIVKPPEWDTSKKK